MSDFETYTKWLSELKAGDKVFIQSRYDSVYPCKVVRTTATQIIVIRLNLVGCNHEVKYRKDDGRLVGGGIWNGTQIIRPTDEICEKYEIYRMISNIRNLWENVALPNDSGQLKEIAAVLLRYQKPKEEKKG